MNVHRLVPAQVISEVSDMRLPLASKEGFIRQVLGWREFVRHVHYSTDGFRILSEGRLSKRRLPGDAGYERWAGKPWPLRGSKGDPDGGAAPSVLGCNKPLFPAFWGEESGLACLDRVVAGVWDEGYSHHITRLMILCNLGALLDVNPRELTDWFWVAYTDAYDWVVEPNVLGMGTYAVGSLMTTKPYVSGSAYINKMSDYCGICAFDPKADCPISSLYWAFLQRHREALVGNPRLGLAMAYLKKREKSRREKDRAVFMAARKKLSSGERLTSKDFSR
jgi:deoxyribodipyrimidine photolyase-related protein